MAVETFPTHLASDRLIREGVRRKALGLAKVGDLVAYCVSSTSDRWTLWPAAAVDDRGQVMGVRARSGEVVRLWGLAALDTYFAIGADQIDLAAAEKLRWRSFQGVVGVREALRPFLVKAGRA
jgi:hypothetical protein